MLKGGEQPLFTPSDFGGAQQRVDARFQDYVNRLPEFELPNHLGGVETGFAWDGKSTMPSTGSTIYTHPLPQAEGSASATVATLNEAKHAAKYVLQRNQFDQVKIFMPRVKPGEPTQVTWNKDKNGHAIPDLTYNQADQVSFNSLTPSRQEAEAAAVFQEQIAMLGGPECNIMEQAVASHDANQIWMPPNADIQMPEQSSEFQLAGIFGGRFGGGCCNVQPYRGSRGSYVSSYGCRTGNCDLSVGSTFRGLLRLQFLRPIRRNLLHLPIKQRLIARVFPRIAYRNGWIDCETAHILLVKRLFVMIVAVGVAGGAIGGGAAGGAAMGVIFIP